MSAAINVAIYAPIACAKKGALKCSAFIKAIPVFNPSSVVRFTPADLEKIVPNSTIHLFT